MSGPLVFLKDPDAAIDYRVDWSAALSGAVSISASSWAVVPDEADGVEVLSDLVDGAVTVARLSGGVSGHVYRVGNRVSLSDGSVDERSLALRVEER